MSVEIDRGVSVDMFVAVTRLLVKKHGKGLRIPNERMETLRRAAAVIECIGEECAANKTS